MQRRTYLQVVGVSTTAVSAAGRAEAAETDTSYGAGGFGEGPYGGSTEAGDPELGDPVVEHLALSDTSPPNPHVDLVTDWAVSHPDGELAAVDITIETAAGGSVDTRTISVSGSRASGTEEATIKHGAGETYVVTLHVTDSTGTTTTKTESLETLK